MKFSVDDAKNGLKTVYEVYGREMAETVESMYRIETNHFKSKQYILSGTPGMEKHGAEPYYGWGSDFFETHPQYSPVGVVGMNEGAGLSTIGGTAQLKNREKIFVKLPSVEAGMMYLASYINKYDGNYARWYSTDTKQQAIYRKQVSSVTPRIVNGFE